MKGAYRKGRAYEWKLREQYEQAGFIVIRAAGSKTPYDLICIHPANKSLVLVQAKATQLTENAKDRLTEKMYGKLNAHLGTNFTLFCEVKSL